MIVIVFICLSCFSYTVQKYICLSLDVGVGLAPIKYIFNAILLLKWLFSCMFWSIAYIPFIFAVKWVTLGLGLGVG